MAQWFRMYGEVLSDRKLARVARSTGQPRVVVLGLWTTLLCLASDSIDRGQLLLAEDHPYMVADLAEETGMEVDQVSALLDEFSDLGMIDMDAGVISICQWSERQFEGDNSTERVQRYREKRVASGMTVTGSYKSRDIIARDGGKCVYCGSTEKLCVDHCVPISQGGTDDDRNLVSACKRCNGGKSGRTPEQAGFVFVDAAAERRYCDYCACVTVTDRTVTVTATPPDTESESESETEQNRDRQQTADSARAKTRRRGAVAAADVLPDDLAALSELGIGEPNRSRILGRHPPAGRIREWANYARGRPSLGNPAGFVIARLLAGDEAPANGSNGARSQTWYTPEEAALFINTQIDEEAEV